jgi:AraC-like DNA-binding protein
MMSQERQAASYAVETRLGERGGLRPHAHPVHQLAWAPDGSVCIGAGDASWLLSRSVALWIPAGVDHDVVADRASVMHNLYFSPDRCPLQWVVPTPVNTTGLVGHLFDHLMETPASGQRERVERVLFDMLEPVPAVTVRLPQLRDDRARRVGEALAANPADDRTLEAWGSFVGASGRTLARLIAAETDMGFAEWRAQVRMAFAAQRLAAGARVGDVALDAGYATPSAFVAAFRRVVGVAPSAFASARARPRAVQADAVAAVTIVPAHARVDLPEWHNL